MSSEDEEVRITLRLPAALRDRLASSAEHRSRSMNGEILARLESSFDSNIDPKALADAYAAAEEMRGRCEEQWNYLQNWQKELEEHSKQQSRDLVRRRKELADKVRTAQRIALDETARVRADLESRREEYRHLIKEMNKREAEMNEAILAFNAREKDLGNVIRALSEGAKKISEA